MRISASAMRPALLIVAGYTDTEMGPVMGLLGTIAGYLLGKNSSQPVEKEAAQ